MAIEEQEVPLYSVQEQPNKTICYVESKTGQHFAIHFADTRIVRKHGLAAQVMIHGEWSASFCGLHRRELQLTPSSRQRGRTIQREIPIEGCIRARREGLVRTSLAIVSRVTDLNSIVDDRASIHLRQRQNDR